MTGAWPAWLRALFLAVALALPAAAAPAAAEWQTLSERDGVVVERRTQEGSRFQEVRATAYTPYVPSAIFETIWNQKEHPQFVPYLKRLDLISENDEERLVYEQVQVPLARDRDYTVRLRKHAQADGQRFEIAFTGANDAGPPPNSKHVRVLAIQGRWTIEPGREGRGSRVRYEILCEPGGAIPSWVANHFQGEAAANLVRAMLQRTRDRK